MHVIAALHPAFLLRQNMRFSGLVELAVKRAADTAHGEKPPAWTEDEFILPGKQRVTADVVVDTLAAMSGGEVAYDVETDGRHPLECSLRCVAFYDGKRGITVPLLYRDGTVEEVQVPDRKGKLRTEKRAVWKPYFSGEALKRVVRAVKSLLEGGAKLLYTQNGQFDRLVLESQLGISCPPGFDTIVAHHLVSPYLPHDLGFLGALYTSVPYYKATAGGDSWASESDAELWLYNLRDVKVTWLVAQTLRKELKEVPQNEALFKHDTWQEFECQRWRKVGVELDPYALAYFRQHYRGVAARALAAMRDIVRRAVGKAGSSADSSEKLQALLEKLTDEEGDPEEASETFNPASLAQLRLLLAGLGVPLEERTATGELSTAKEFLTGARKQLLSAGVPASDDRVAFLDYLFAWREASKVDSTYLRPEVLSDGRVHPSFSVHVTPTGRLSSSGPNFQNQPAEVRGMFVARRGHVLVSMDWDALEMRLGAFNSGDPNYVEVFRAYDEKRGPKPHIVNMSVIFGVPATKEAAEKYPHLYRAAKIFAYAGAYGATDLTMYEQMREEMPDLKFDAFKVVVNNYKKRYARLFEFQEEVVQQGTRYGFIDSGILKRRSFYFESAWGGRSPEASAMQNFPYQSTGADVVGLANKRIMEKLVIPWRRTKLKPGEVLEQLAQVHDELLFEVPERLVDKFKVELKRLAEEPPPGKSGWNLPVDIKVGRRWKPVQTRCPKCRELVDVEMSKPNVWEGSCAQKHEVKVVVDAEAVGVREAVVSRGT